MKLNHSEHTFLTELAKVNKLTIEEASDHLMNPQNREIGFQAECVIYNQSITKLNLGVEKIGVEKKIECYGYTKFNHLPSFIHLSNIERLSITTGCNLPPNASIHVGNVGEFKILGQKTLISLALEGSISKITCYGNNKMELLDISQALNLKELKIFEVPKLKFRIKDIQTSIVEGLSRLKGRILHEQTVVASTTDLSVFAEKFALHSKWDTHICADIVRHKNCSMELMEKIYWELAQKVYPHYSSKSQCNTKEEGKAYGTLSFIEKQDWNGQSKSKNTLSLEVEGWAKMPSNDIARYSKVAMLGSVTRIKKKKQKSEKETLRNSNNRSSAPIKRILSEKEQLERDKIKKKINSINRQLKTHGGNDNKIKLRGLTYSQYDFLAELFFNKIEDFKKITQVELEIYYAENIKKYGFSSFCKSGIHIIDVPLEFNSNSNWQLTMGTESFGGPEMVFEFKGWEIISQVFVD